VGDRVGIRVLAAAEGVMIKRHPEPLLWMLFSAGGVMSGMLMPILVLLFGIAFPLAWLTAPSHERMLAVLGNPLSRLTLLALCVLSLFHWAHRFRHTLYDGLQIKHLNEVIALVSYGIAVVGSVASAYLLWQVP
jgi:fumarate reductase subunit D